MTDLTLCMIVKDEAKVVARCLASVRPLVTGWVVVDTGSTDGTQAVVREAMEGVPGELHERPWRDFASNRNEAIDLASKLGDYLLVVDADDAIEVPPGFRLPPLTEDAYQLLVRYGATGYYRTQIFNWRRGYRYEGVLHELLASRTAGPEARLEGLVYRVHGGGARSADPAKYRNDARVLERALEAEPGNPRNAFYLAQSWRDAGELEKARACYRACAAMGGWAEEVFYSLHEVAKLSERLGAPEAEVIAAYLRAYEVRPTRAESTCSLARYLRLRDRVVVAYPFARVAASTPRPGDRLFLDESVYAWRALDELSVSAYWAGEYRVALEATEALLRSPGLPDEDGADRPRARAEANLGHCRAKFGQR